MKDIFLLRHGEISPQGRYIGSTQSKLTKKGIQQILGVAHYFDTVSLDVIYCSPMKRCLQSYQELITHDLQCNEMVQDDRLVEIDFGEWEGKNYNEISKSHPQEIINWAKNGDSFRFPGGESLGEFRQRIIEFSQLLQITEAKSILLITHGGVIRHLICQLLNLSFDNYLYFHVNYGQLTTITLHSEGGILTGLNIGGREWEK